MKKFLFFCFAILFLTRTVSAQWVPVTDPAFLNFLQTNYPSCVADLGVGDWNLNTSCPEIVNEDSLTIMNIFTVDLTLLPYFVNLTYLKLDGLGIPFWGIPPSIPPNIQTLIYNNIDAGDALPLNGNLRYMEAISNPSISFYTGFPNSLRYLNCSNSMLSSLPALPLQLDTLICGGQRGAAPATNLLSSLPNLPSTLKYLDCSPAALTSLPALPPGLIYLNCSGNSVNLSPQDFQKTLGSLPALPPSLEYLNASSNKLTSLPTLPHALKYLNVSFQRYYQDDLIFGGSASVIHPGISQLPDLPPTLETLIVSDNALQTLPDLPATLTYLDASYNIRPHGQDPVSAGISTIGSSLPPGLATLKVNYTLVQCIPHLPASITVVATEASRVTCLPNSGAYSAQPSRPLCSPVNNVNGCQAFPVIAGSLFYDHNSNGVQDPNENGRANVEVQAASGLSAYSNINGYFEITGDTGTNTINIVSPTPYAAVPSTATYVFSSFDTLVNDTYALQPTVMLDSLRVSMVNNFTPRPGFDFGYTINYENVGTTVIASNMKIAYDATNLSFIDATIPGVTNAAGVLTIPVINTTPGDKESFSVAFTLNASAVLGDTLLGVVSASVNAGSVSDSVFNIITGSYDPNDKNATPVLSPQQVSDGSYINYIVRFQNTGTDTAFNVVITDQLETQLDVSSFQMLETSHPAIVKRDNRLLTFEFLNIQLPDSNVNEPLSHGYIKFRVKPITTLVDGDVVTNKARIYFDYNSSVLTNTAVTSIVSPQVCFTISASTTDALCAQPSGSLTVTVSGGTSPFSYALNNGTPQASPDFTALPSGTYSVKVSDATGCVDSVNVTINSSVSVLVNASSTPASCAGVNNGTITVTPNSGTPPYSYSLDGGAPQASETFTGVSAGSHTVLVTDASGCTGTRTLSVVAGSGITIAASATPDGCLGSGSGTITVMASSGAAPYNYSINSGPLQSSPDFTGLVAGVYSVEAIDANGCMGSLSVTVAPATTFTATASSTPASCAGVNNGTITVTPNSGTPPYSYSLDGGAPQASETFTGVTAGPHTVVVTDANGCSASVDITVTSGTGFIAAASTTASDCGLQNATITVTPNGGIAPYTYTLNSGTSQASEIFTNVSAGTHIISIEDASGCIASLTAVVGETPISATLTTTQSTCLAGGTIEVTGSTGTAPFMYSIDGGTMQSAAIFDNLIAGSYVVLVQDANMCTYTETVTINASPGTVLPTVSITSDVTSVCSGEPVTFTATATNGGANPQFEWTVNGSVAGTNAATLTINPTVNSDVSVQLTSDDPCASPTTANSNTLSVTVDPQQTSLITIAGNTTVDQGASTNITSSVVNGGTSPSYQWQDSTASHTWANITGATNSSIDYTPQQTGDGLRSILTSTGRCTSSSTATSNALYFTVNSTSTPRMRLYPNPVRSVLTIENTNQTQWVSADILDDNGRKVTTFPNSSSATEVRMDVSMLMSGVYFIRLIDRNGKPEYFKFVKQ